MLVASSALSCVVSLVKIIIERSFVPQVPFEKFSTVGRGERPDRNEVYEVVVRFECAEVLFALWHSCYEILFGKKHDYSRMRLKKITFTYSVLRFFL